MFQSRNFRFKPISICVQMLKVDNVITSIFHLPFQITYDFFLNKQISFKISVNGWNIVSITK